MTKLSDTQSILLSAAAARDSGSVLPFPETLTAPAMSIARSITALMKRALVVEREIIDPTNQHRMDGDIGFGLFITDAGRIAIGVEPVVSEPGLEHAPDDTVPSAVAAKSPSKAATVVAMLQREEGATLAELAETTGWLPHTTRAALTGLRKKGHAIAKGKRADVTCYSIGKAA